MTPSTQPQHPSTAGEQALEELYARAEYVEDEGADAPREAESALLTITLFVSLVVFAVGCIALW